MVIRPKMVYLDLKRRLHYLMIVTNPPLGSSRETYIAVANDNVVRIAHAQTPYKMGDGAAWLPLVPLAWDVLSSRRIRRRTKLSIIRNALSTTSVVINSLA